MGYTLTIGSAAPEIPDDLDEDNEPGWRVQGMAHPDAPSFPGDEMTGKGSSRSPSYSAWADFCDATGLRDLFYGASPNNNGGKYTRDVCLIRSHPGVALLRPADLLEIRHARIQWEARKWPTEERIAGWEGRDPFSKAEPDPRYDGNLARLLWLEWWVAYALENIKLPAMGNT